MGVMSACSLFFGSLFFMIFAISVDSPDIVFAADTADDILNRRHSGQHGVVLVVVFVHAIAADEEKVLKPVSIVPNYVEAVIRAKIGRISFGNANHMRVFDFLSLENADLRNFVDGQARHLIVIELPQGIGLVAEVFQADPNLVRAAYKPRAPVVEDLQSADLHIRLLNVDPVVFQL